MQRDLKIRIKKRSQPESLAWFLLILPFCFGLINSLLGLPAVIRYTLDIVWLILFIMILRFKRSIRLPEIKPLVVWVVLFLLWTLLVYIIQYQSGLYYLWGVRNNFRFYAAFLAFGMFFSYTGSKDLLDLLDKLFWINAVVSVVQFFAMGFSGDFLGGIFGTETGANGYTNIFFVIILTKSMLCYLERKETFKKCAFKVVVAIFVAALAELKFFFVEVIILTVFAVLITDFTWRKFWIIVGGVVALLVGAAFLTYLFPSFAGWFSWRWMLSSATSNRGYTSSGDINRLTALSTINDLWLDHWWQRMFGLGLGNCDTSSFGFLNTPFFRQYGGMHYSWFSYAHMYLECGWIGLVFYFGFFAMVWTGAYRISKRCMGIRKTYAHMAMIMAVMCVAISIYNSSLRTEAGYMAYFILALPFMRSGEENMRKRSDLGQQYGKDEGKNE